MGGINEKEAIAEVLRRTAPGKDWPGVYVLGAFVKGYPRYSQQPRITLVSQQTRALNLVYALTASGALKAGDHVCVIGGGVAGLTAAAGAGHHQCEVTLLESKGHLLPLIHNTTRRWLHPYLYEWPEEGSERPEAGLPLINWRAAAASLVFKQISEAFACCQKGGRITPYVNVSGLKIRRAGDEWQVDWNHGTDRFRAIILAVGFGVETGWPGVDHLSYWDNDNLDREDTRQKVTHIHHFVSGCGDGGLIDFIRVRLRQFDHEGTFRKFLQVAPASGLRDTLRQIDARAGGDGGALAAEYHRLKVPEIDSWIMARLRRSTSATLHGQASHPYITKAAALNRFLVSRILKADAGVGSRYQPGELLRPIAREGDRYVVAIKDEGGQRVEARFDEVTIRHGVDPALRTLGAAFGRDRDLYAACQGLPAGEEPDPTRRPLFPPDYFGGAAPISTQLPPLPEADESEIVPAGTNTAQQPQVPCFEPAAAPGPPSKAESRPGAREVDMRVPTRGSLRKVLDEVFPLEDELMAFCQAYFFDIWRKFGGNMNRTAKMNMLLAHSIQVQILQHLREDYARQLAPHENLLRYEE